MMRAPMRKSRTSSLQEHYRVADIRVSTILRT